MRVDEAAGLCGKGIRPCASFALMNQTDDLSVRLRGKVECTARQSLVF